MEQCEHLRMRLLVIGRRDMWLCEDCKQSMWFTRKETKALAQESGSPEELRRALAEKLSKAG